MRQELETVKASDGSTAQVTKHGPGVFCLKITSRNTKHARWGTRKEIDSDIEFFKVTGRLPVSCGASWL